MIKLTPRLELCAEMCPACSRAVDVGCDHGYLIIRMVEDGKALKGLACDLRKGPLENAKKNIAQHGLESRIETVLTDGLNGIEGGEGDVVTICGMGGDLIADIISRAEWVRKAAVIAQPMSKQERLREFCLKNGYNITEERLVWEDRRLYVLMRIESGEYEGEDHMLWSAAMERDPLFRDYLEMTAGKYRHIYRGSGNAADSRMLAMLEEKIRCHSTVL